LPEQAASDIIKNTMRFAYKCGTQRRAGENALDKKKLIRRLKKEKEREE
jgi:hypothetical protein